MTLCDELHVCRAHSTPCIWHSVQEHSPRSVRVRTELQQILDSVDLQEQCLWADVKPHVRLPIIPLVGNKGTNTPPVNFPQKTH